MSKTTSRINNQPFSGFFKNSFIFQLAMVTPEKIMVPQKCGSLSTNRKIKNESIIAVFIVATSQINCFEKLQELD
jgi:hypothetical protein